MCVCVQKYNIVIIILLLLYHIFIVQNVITVTEGLPPVTEYHSVIYYHNNKPRWNEMFKVCEYEYA